MTGTTICTKSGRSLDELTIDALRAGNLSPEDFRISREQLNHQAAAAESAGNRQLAENLRRAAEMTGMSQQQVFEIYNLLRPGRATYAELITLAGRLQDEMDMPLVAAFIREAAEAYRGRGVTRTQ
jgi:propanediol dehydratase small subunit